MLLKRIVDWLSYNHEFNSPKNETGVNESADSDDIKSNSKIIWNDSHNISRETSVLDLCLMPEINTADNSDGNSEENKFQISHDQKNFVSAPGSAFIPTKKLKSSENSEWLNNSKKSTLRKHRMIPDTISKENKANGINTSESDTEHKLGASQSVHNISSLQGLKSRHRQLDECKHNRSTFTQTDAVRGDEQTNSMIEISHKPALTPVKKNKTFCVNRAARNNSSVFPQSSESKDYGFEAVIYGVLLVFGCNRAVPEHLVGTMGTKFVLRKRIKANGLKKAFSYMRPTDEQISISPAKHFISYTLPSNRSVVVAFKFDKMTDMFQIGRYEEPSIDFKVSDVSQLNEARNGVSRFACRILVNRETHEARIYAAAFDSSKAIFLGEAGIICNRNGEMDGFTTNGVLIKHPHKNWREVSICGYVYPLRSPKVDAKMRSKLVDETNILEDGTLIDLCGITLLWRTLEGLRNTPDEDYLSRLQSSLNKSVPECQLLIPNVNLPASVLNFPRKKAYVYLSCGHVIGLALSGTPENLKGWSCPVCRAISPIAELRIGSEPGFYFDRDFPSHAFRPCGHVASFKTVVYWSSISVPNHRHVHSSRCPFCGVKLNSIVKFVKLILPE